MIHVHILGDGEGCLASICFARTDHRKLTDMLDPFFHNDPWRGTEEVPQIIAIGGFLRSAQLDLPFAIVAEGRSFNHAGKANRLHGSL